MKVWSGYIFITVCTSCHSGFGNPRHCLSATGRAHAADRQPPSLVLSPLWRPRNHLQTYINCICISIYLYPYLSIQINVSICLSICPSIIYMLPSSSAHCDDPETTCGWRIYIYIYIHMSISLSISIYLYIHQ